MFSNQPADLVLPSPLRSCCSLRSSGGGASSSSSGQQQRFLAGTASTSGSGGENALHLLRYHEDANELGHDAALSHPTGEVWCLSANPRRGDVVVTCGGGAGGTIPGGAATTKVWRVPGELLEKDDDLPYNDEDDDDDNANNNYNRQIVDSDEAPVDLISEATLFVDSDDVLGGRITSALFRPLDPDDEFGDGGSAFGGIDAAKDLLTVNAALGTVTRWDLEAGAAEVGQIEPSGNNSGGRGVMAERRAAWDPHNAHLVAVTGPNGITIHDLRTAGSGGGGGIGGVASIEHDPLAADVSALLAASARGVGNHRGCGTADVSYNPNLPNVLTTAGRDGLIKFWDLRTTTSTSSLSSAGSSPSYPPPTMAKHQRRIQPLKVLRGGHTHWSNRVAYNPHHDQLLLSSGTDGVVNLWRVGSVSSAPLLDLNAGGGGGGADGGGDGENDIIGLGGSYGYGDDDEDDEDRQDAANGGEDGGGRGGSDARVGKFEFPDAVYDLAWSAADAWTFLTVAYDGTASLNHVPSREKYKILL